MSELKIIAGILLKPEHKEEVKKALFTIVDESRKEEGNISYDLHQDTKEPLKYIFIEVWKSQQAIDSHNTSIHFRNFVKSIEGKFDSLEIDIIKKVY
ncbi:putative quinol monooxygenase [Apibacter raozihei]|uniref:putative quinol monooxygenase n=1 Tax=Apibacter TaxID=1778601 RepID=UPI000FE2A845|nr:MULTISPECIES: putative quinol monooxygenase [Apibacter]